tara:strand:- start:4647 stop:5906 length:1260 start_codon:yes stop_codon:yes gene_type:complete
MIDKKLDKYNFKEEFKFVVHQHQNLFDALKQARARPIFVGGCVRDFVLGRSFTDIDIEVHGIEQDELEALLEAVGGFQYTGRAFGVYRTDGLEIAMPRLERKIGTKHTDFAVDLDPNLSFQMATKRRDLTINAMGYDWFNEELLDPYEGLADCQNGILREVCHKTFREDDLRALRVAQFISRLGFESTDSLIQLCAEADLSVLSRERIGAELYKLIWIGEAPLKGFKFLEQTALINQLFLGEFEKGQRQAFYHCCQRCAENEDDFLRAKAIYVAFFWYGPQDKDWLQKELVGLGFAKNDVVWGRRVAQWMDTLFNATQKKIAFYEALYQLSLLNVDIYQVAALVKVLDGDEWAIEEIEKVCFDDLAPKVQAADLLTAGVLPGPRVAELLKMARVHQYMDLEIDKKQLLEIVLGDSSGTS